MEAIEKGGYKHLKFENDSIFLVTGCAGFIGSNLVEALLNLGYKVKGIDNFSTGKKENIIEFIENKNFKFIEGDICNLDTCRNICKNVTYILNQAALGSVPKSMKYPVIYVQNNILGTVNMMQAAVENNVKRFVYASSSSVYGSSNKLPKYEGEEGEKLSPYALTKWVDEEFAKLYFNLYNLETIGLRYFNVFGKRQDPYSTYAAVIPIFIKNILDGKSPTINGDGEQSRDFTYIENVIEANLKACLAKKEACGKAYNIAYGEKNTLNELYNKLATLLKSNIKPIYGPARQGDVKHSQANIENSRKYLKYNPQYDINLGLELAIEWYKRYLKG